MSNSRKGLNVSHINQTHQTVQATLHDGANIDVEIYGQGPDVLLPVNPHPVEGPQAEAIRQYGVDPALGRNLIDGLSDVFRVIAFDYEGHVLRHPKPLTLTPDALAADMLAVADAAQAARFAYYGYSWLAVAGLQLALRTNRLLALVMGGYSPLDGPYTDMLGVTAATYEMAVNPQPADKDDKWYVNTPPEQARQFLTLYEALRGFDDRAVQSQITCPRLCFVGSADRIHYTEKWNNILVNIADPIIRNQAELETLGWDVRVVEGLDHTQAMQSQQVLPILRPWLIANVGS
jgi:pimeloyl-ACP methyl ester carboxylesterase